MEFAGVLGPMTEHRCPWTESYEARTYIDQVRSLVEHERLATERLDRLGEAIAQIIKAAGGRRKVPDAALPHPRHRTLTTRRAAARLVGQTDRDWGWAHDRRPFATGCSSSQTDGCASARLQGIWDFRGVEANRYGRHRGGALLSETSVAVTSDPPSLGLCRPHGSW